VVSAGSRDRERLDSLRLADDVGHIEFVLLRRERRHLRIRGDLLPPLWRPGMPGHGPGEMVRRDDLHTGNERGLGRRRSGDDDSSEPEFACGDGRGEQSCGATQLSVEAEFSDVRGFREPPVRESLRCRERRECDRKVEARPLLGQVCRREVHGDEAVRERHPGLRGRGADPELRLGEGGVRKTDDRHAGQLLRDGGFDHDGGALESG